MLAVQKMPTSLAAACVGLGVSATLSLQTVHRTVCLTLAFEPRYLFSCLHNRMREGTKCTLSHSMVEITGLEPVTS